MFPKNFEENYIKVPKKVALNCIKKYIKNSIKSYRKAVFL